MLRDLIKSTKGQTLVEYAIIIIVIAVIAAAAVLLLGPIVRDLFTNSVQEPTIPNDPLNP